MALNLSNDAAPHQIANRIRTLIARQDAGDITAAARRLERPIEDVYHLERTLSADAEPAALDLLATVVRRYDADACWLLTGRDVSQADEFSSDVRGRLVHLLSAVSDRIIEEARRGARLS